MTHPIHFTPGQPV